MAHKTTNSTETVQSMKAAVGLNSNTEFTDVCVSVTKMAVCLHLVADS